MEEEMIMCPWCKNWSDHKPKACPYLSLEDLLVLKDEYYLKGDEKGVKECEMYMHSKYKSSWGKAQLADGVLTHGP